MTRQETENQNRLNEVIRNEQDRFDSGSQVNPPDGEDPTYLLERFCGQLQEVM